MSTTTKLNATTVMNAFLLPFTDGILDAVAGHEIYSFHDGFSGYNQARMHPMDQEKTTFVTEWGVFVAVVTMFGLKKTPSTFQRVIQEIVKTIFIHLCKSSSMISRSIVVSVGNLR